MLKNPLVALLSTVVIGIGLLVWSLAVGQQPLLGLDLQGGVEVVLEPVDTPENLALATEDNLNTAVEILRKRVDAIGVAEPDITTQTGGDNNFIIVQLPGIENQDDAVALVGATAQLQFRPVLLDLGDAASITNISEIGDFGDEITNGGPDVTDVLAGVLSDPTDTPADQSAIFRTAAVEEGAPLGAPVLVGPTEFTGTALSGADALFLGGQWQVEVTFQGRTRRARSVQPVSSQMFCRTPAVVVPIRPACVRPRWCRRISANYSGAGIQQPQRANYAPERLPRSRSSPAGAHSGLWRVASCVR